MTCQTYNIYISYTHMQSSRVRFNQWYKKSANKASVLKRMKEYYQKNKGKITKKRESRSSQISAYNKRYYKRNK